MPGFRRWGKSKFERNPESSFKLLAAIIVITLYLLFKEFQNPTFRGQGATQAGAQIQYADWNGTGKVDETRANSVRDAMKYTFWKYKERAWGHDDILPVSGRSASSRNGWGAFIVDSASTLALMGLWDELAHSLEHMVAINFTQTEDLVDPFETTIRYLGGLLSIVDLFDVGLIPEDVLTGEARDLILDQAVVLAGKLAPAYDTPTGLPWPRVDFKTEEGEPHPSFILQDDPAQREFEHPAIGPARIGSSILENRVLTRLTGDDIYVLNSTKAWAPLVWSNWRTPWPGMVDAPVDIMTGEPVRRQRHWDGGHNSYYEYLVKMTILAPPSDPHLPKYKERFVRAAYSLRRHLASRSAPAPGHLMQHLYLGRQDDEQFENQQGHLACFAPGTILLASKFYTEKPLRTFALALLEGCHHAYTSTPTKIAPETWSWTPKFSYDKPLFAPETPRQKKEASTTGIWSRDPAYKGRPEYVESIFYAWRITGEQRYRDWAWDAFSALEKYCKAPFGYAQLADVYDTSSKDETRWVDVQESFWAAKTLKYLWLTFSDVEVTSLDSWVFSTEGHPFRMIR
ncbi:glycoside hydrolase family 47 protein [Bipolaris maydis ATCC 48331]|uniref:alpha-1,2-Mannosidase n=2 Tax=Cochliobolus heterostrophus TaxID=5016 RepID=M2TNW5_COCH5|nr:glycoside hydrolase family 47 protein [Bipolaris maydis ATCC 48331]EMD88229.1 glycoside hydrolase family 47 protein [Bipolaris maydis C5]KAH7549164.1 glycoside hydrolase family 47 protein [Bipolaris maydis]ENI02192.1 glycoside hydrolase family 47 protein [Bipolaris maydis ATCC 48331]KAJ5024473.1 glycoside hydrolase [Bipolaris maydis]KAJ5057884.1 glycoside hydrolase [Bipolaris maydis]